MERRGFSLVELFVVIAIIAVVVTAGFSLYKVWQDRSSINSGEAVLVSALREAQSMAALGGNDSNWGVKYLSGSPAVLTVFSGSSYDLRAVAYDKVFTLPRGVTVSGLNEYIFIKFTGLPQSSLSGTVNYGGQTIQVNINAQGVLSR